MNWQVFASTFVLIFLAELGDKTQLAAMARVVSDGSARWTIFAAASMALVCSTLIAVLVGDALTRVIPERTIRMAAALLFVVFGLVLFHQALASPAPTRVPEAPAEHARPGLVTSFIFRMATAFERAAAVDYRKLAAQSVDPRERAVLEAIARDEEAHADTISGLASRHSDASVPRSALAELPDSGELVADVHQQSEPRPVIEHALEHERATARFYEELAGITPIPAIKKAFHELAAAERTHVKKLEAL